MAGARLWADLSHLRPGELEPQLAAAGIDRTVLVQAANSYEDTDSMLRHAAAHEWIGAVVGWVPLEDAERGGARRSMSGTCRTPGSRASATSTTRSPTLIG